jgi:membrane associated rhomboid family serine protease
MRPITLIIVTLNIIAYLLELGAGGQTACDAWGLVPARFVRSGSLEPLFTSLFLHDPASLYHIAGNMAFLALFGAVVEGAIGGLPFLAIYFAAGATGGLLHILVNPAATDPLVGASGAICGLFAVGAVLRPRLLGFVGVFIGIEIWHAISSTGGDVSFGAHLGGFAFGSCVAMGLRAVGSEALETT